MKFIRALSRINLTLFFIVSLLISGCSDDDQTTEPTGPQESWVYKPLGDGIDGTVYAIADFNGKLYVGGNFLIAGSDTARYVAAWDGSQWFPLGIGTSYPVYAFTEYNGKLIVGGSFGSAGGIQVNRIAAWDGLSWSALGTGLVGDYAVRDMCVLRDTLFVVGHESIHADSKLIIAAWDGSDWTMLESGTPGRGNATCAYPGGLLVGGYNIISGMQQPFVKTISAGDWYDWDSTSLTGSLYDLALYNGVVYSAGSGTFPVKYFSVSWHNISVDGFQGYNSATPHVYEFCELSGNMVAVGEFESINGTEMNGIAAWDGSAWSPMGGGMTNGRGFYSLNIWQDKMYIGGEFTVAGGVATNNIVEVSFE